MGTRARLDDFEKKEKSLFLAGIRTPDHPARALVSIMTKDKPLNLLPNISNYMREEIRHLHGRDDINPQPATTNFPGDEVNAERVHSVLF